jgi:hypothetical protein
MQFRLESGSAAAALGLAGTGVALAFPEQRWLGFILIAFAVVVFLFDLRVEHGGIEAGGHRLVRLFGSAGFSLESRWALSVLIGLIPVVSIYLVFHFAWWVGVQHARYGTVFPESKEHLITAPPEVLMSFYKDRTNSEGDRLAAPYKGKWMSVTAIIHDIREGFDDTVTVFSDGPVTLSFEKNWLTSLQTSRRGDRIYALGRLTRVTESTISLDDCELIQLPTNPPAASPPIPEPSR